MIFCKFDPAFVRLLRDWLRPGEYIVDCGAGEGHLQDVLNREVPGVQVISLDLFPGSELVLRQDCEDWPFNAAAVPVFVRPCHSGFVERTIRKAAEDGVSRALYIGLPKNLNADLPNRDAEEAEGNDRYGCERSKAFRRWTGPEGELVWELTLPQGLLQTFVLGRLKFWDHPSWLKVRGDGYLENIGGGRMPNDSSVIVLETVRAVDFWDRALDWKKTGLGQQQGTDAGWLSRSGEWFPCRREDHDLFARMILRKKTPDMEREGWVRVYGAPGTVRIFGEVSGLSWSRLSGNDEGSFVRDRLSPEQVAWLRDHGHDVRSWEES